MKKGYENRMRRFLYIVPIVAMSMTLAGCGTKPNNVLPPDGAEDAHYPRAYPDPSTDPQTDSQPDAAPSPQK